MWRVYGSDSMHKRENLNIQSHIVRAFQKSFFFYILISNPAPLLKATRLVPGRPSEAETYSSTKQLKIRHADSYTCSYHIKCVPMCFHPQQFVRNALSNSFYWQSAWRSCQDGGIVAIQVLNWYIYIPTCNPSPMPKRFSNIKGKTMWPTLLGIWRIPWPHGSSASLWLHYVVQTRSCPLQEGWCSLMRVSVCTQAPSMSSAAKFCGDPLIHHSQTANVGCFGTSRTFPRVEFGSHRFVQVGEPPFWCSKSDRGSLHSRQSLRYSTTLKPQ
jgi:hypothetical protein